MSGIIDGQAVDAVDSNAAWLAKNGDDTTIGKVTLNNADVASGSQITNAQRELNSLASKLGVAINEAYNATISFTNNAGMTNPDSMKGRVENVSAKFDSSTGHAHSGTQGDGTPIQSLSVAGVRLHGNMLQGTNLTTVTGTSTDVSTQLTGKTHSTSDSVKGVVVTAPYNKVILKNSTNTDFVDALGNIVYGRLTWAASVWTLSYYSDVSGTETAYTFVSSTVQWWYQELFNPIVDAPVYSDLLFTPSDNTTSDVVDASTSTRGVVSTGTQSFAGNKTFTGTVAASNLSGTNTGDVSLAAVGSSPSANGASLSGQALTLQPADLTHPGLVTALSQTFGGAKTFNADIIAQGILVMDHETDTTSGSLVTLSTPVKVVKRLTNASLVSISTVTAPSVDQFSVLVNATGVSVVVKNGSGVITGSGGDFTFNNGSSIWLWYDSAGSAWRMIGGSGGGITSVTASSPLASSGGATPDISLGTVPIAKGGTNATSQTLTGGALYFDGTKITTDATNDFINYDGSGHTGIGGAANGAYPLQVTGTVNITGALVLGTALGVAAGGTGVTTTGQNYVFAGPTSGGGAPAMRLLVAGDIPTLNQNTSGTAAGLSSVLAIASGGTNNGSLAVTAGGTLYTDGSKVVNVGAGTSGQFLKSNGASAPTWAAPTVSYTAPTVQSFTSGSGTYTTPANVLYIKVTAVGGGSGGGGSSTGTPTNATAGGNTTFGTTLIVANGGGANSGGTPGTGGTASLGAAIGLAASGGDGNGGIYMATGGVFISPGGIGATSPLGGGGIGGAGGAGANAKANSGSGGSGGGLNGTGGLTGGPGGAAGGYVQAIIGSPSATYSYTVGSGGAGASAGTSGFAGGSGGSGIILVEEFY